MMFNGDSDEDKLCSAFHLLEQACLELAEVSYKINNSNITDVATLPNGHRPVYGNFIYSRMLWGKSGIRIVGQKINFVFSLVSLAMKFHDARGAITTRSTKLKWREYFTRYHHRIYFTTECLTELRKGLELGKSLELPSELACSSHHLGDLMASEKVIRPFHRLT